MPDEDSGCRVISYEELSPGANHFAMSRQLGLPGNAVLQAATEMILGTPTPKISSILFLTFC